MTRTPKRSRRSLSAHRPIFFVPRERGRIREDSCPTQATTRGMQNGGDGRKDDAKRLGAYGVSIIPRRWCAIYIATGYGDSVQCLRIDGKANKRAVQTEILKRTVVKRCCKARLFASPIKDDVRNVEKGESCLCFHAYSGHVK